jgi:hypothetical protein
VTKVQALYQEDVNRLTRKLTDETVRLFLDNHGVRLTNEQEDVVFEGFLAVLEKVCGYPQYASYL